MNHKKTYNCHNCILCKKEIDDDGDNFCSKCRTKDWKLRFIAIQSAERVRNQMGKAQRLIRNNPHYPANDKVGSYYEKGREI